MKRVTSPKFWNAGRKNKVWIFTPRPGPHSKRFSFPLSVLLRDILNLVSDAREARAAIKNREILVDGVARRDTNFPVGLLDIVSIPSMKKHYRIVPVQKGLTAVEISEKEATTKLLRIVRKQMIAGKTQITTHDGRNFLDVKNAAVGDTLVIAIDKEGRTSVKKVLKMEEGALTLIFKGRQSGKMGSFYSVDKTVKLKDGKTVFEAPLDYVMIIGKTKPEITVNKVEGEE
ncbi:MAG: 30S ribosomal protein S4e [Candidatus Altiarchaeota archaeon]|nr:30S ribosomal protein S4e [Candidatus Altiarchaeota archaeon]